MQMSLQTELSGLNIFHDFTFNESTNFHFRKVKNGRSIHSNILLFQGSLRLTVISIQSDYYILCVSCSFKTTKECKKTFRELLLSCDIFLPYFLKIDHSTYLLKRIVLVVILYWKLDRLDFIENHKESPNESIEKFPILTNRKLEFGIMDRSYQMNGKERNEE